MKIIYYPYMFLNDEILLKQLLLSWGNVETIVPPSQKEYIDAYLAGEITHETHLPLELYKEIYDIAGARIIDFLVIDDEERIRASEEMFELITKWNKDTGFYDSLRINSIEDLAGKTVEWYWFLHEKLERDLVELMLEEQLVLNWAPGEIVGKQEVGKAYMSIIADEIKKRRCARLVTDDEFLLAAKAGLDQCRIPDEREQDDYQLVSLAIPQVFLDEKVLEGLTWKDIVRMRQDLLPLAEAYYTEVEEYQNAINQLAGQGNDGAAFDKFCEFCERVARSFRPFAKETGKVFRLANKCDGIGLLNGVVLPTIKLLKPDPMLAKVCDIAAISSTAGQYALGKRKISPGFEYLENLNRALNLERCKQMISCLVPKSIKN